MRITSDPERWLRPDSVRLRNYLTPFSRGSRQCLGIKWVYLSIRIVYFCNLAAERSTIYWLTISSLAYCELYLTLAAVFAPGRFEWEPFETTVEDVETYHDFFTPFPRIGTKGMRMLVN